MKELEDLCRDRFQRFGTAGQAGKIRPIPMDEMAKRYASGALDPQIAAAQAA
jgi:fructose-bisphosphate aldolase class II